MATLLEWNGGALPDAAGTNPPTVDGDEMIVPGPSDGYARWFVEAAQFTTRFYMTMPASWAGNATDVFRAYVSSPEADVAIAGSGTPGQARFADSASQTGASPADTLTLGETYRFEFQVDGPNDSTHGRVYDSTDTVLYDTGLVSGTVTDGFTEFRFGRLANNDMPEFRMSHLRVDDTLAWIGPYQPAGITIEVWDGTALVPATLEVWDGSALVPATLTIP